MCFRSYGSPYGLYGSLCTLHLAVASFGATLDMSGWLDLTQQGLSPCQKYQALLGVLTFRLADVPESWCSHPVKEYTALLQKLDPT